MSNRRPTHPGELLREDILPAIGHTNLEIAQLLEIPEQELNDIMNKFNPKPITQDMAERLGKFFGNGSDLWIKMQAAYDNWKNTPESNKRDISELKTLNSWLDEEGIKEEIEQHNPSDMMSAAHTGEVELGPDGKEWAKTEAGYRHVEAAKNQSFQGASPVGGLVWHGHAVREAFVAGAEWQEARVPSNTTPAPSIAALTAEVERLRGEVVVADACNRGLVRLNEAVSVRAETAETELARCREALAELVHAVCGETGFANAVRKDSGLAYPWPALDEAETKARTTLEALGEV